MGQSTRPIALIADPDTEQREFVGPLLEETGFEVIEVMAAEQALDILRTRAHAIVLIVAGMDQPSFLDGKRLALCAQRWPWIRVVVTSDDSIDRLPPPAVAMPKPWLPLHMLIEAEKALAAGAR